MGRFAKKPAAVTGEKQMIPLIPVESLGSAIQVVFCFFSFVAAAVGLLLGRPA
jgi:hypothetical protein